MERAATFLVAVATLALLFLVLLVARTAHHCFDRETFRPGFGEGVPGVPLAAGAAAGVVAGAWVAATTRPERRRRSAARLARAALVVALVAAAAGGVAIQVGAAKTTGVGSWRGEADFLFECTDLSRGILACGGGAAALLALTAGAVAVAVRRGRAGAGR